MISDVWIGWIFTKQYSKISTYAYCIIHLFDPNTQDDLEFTCQSWNSHPHYILTFQIYRMDYPDQDFTELKYSDALTPIIWRNQSHFDPHTDFVSTWLYLVAFRYCIRNVGSPALNHSELLASHYDDLRFERHLCPYALQSTVDSRALSRWVICLVMIFSYISPVCHISVSIFFSYEDNQSIWGTMIYTR